MSQDKLLANKKILITGTSSGIGRAFVKELVLHGSNVWGVARRKHLLYELRLELGTSSKFNFSCLDLSDKNAWKKLIGAMRRKRFVPDIVVFNAAILDNDFAGGLDPGLTRKMFEVNFFSVMLGIAELLKFVKPKTQFVSISSLSALKGSGLEGVGYPASKAALSVAFESLHRRFGQKYVFKTIYFGPVATGMGPFEKRWPVILSEGQAVRYIIEALRGKKALYYWPRSLFLALKTAKLLPSNTYFRVLEQIERVHSRLKRKQRAPAVR